MLTTSVLCLMSGNRGSLGVFIFVLFFIRRKDTHPRFIRVMWYFSEKTHTMKKGHFWNGRKIQLESSVWIEIYHWLNITGNVHFYSVFEQRLPRMNKYRRWMFCVSFFTSQLLWCIFRCFFLNVARALYDLLIVFICLFLG